MIPAASRRRRGFTLLELMVVLFIIGVTLTFATLTLGNGAAERLEREANRLQALMRMASEQAVLFGVEIGLDITRDGYRFLELTPTGWQLVQGMTTPLHPRTLPDGMELTLIKVERGTNGRDRLLHPRGTPTSEETQTTNGDDDTGPRPEVLFLSSGTITPFTLQLAAEDVAFSYIFEGRFGGKVSMRRVEPAGA